MSKRAVWFGMFVGSTIGSFVPMLWHASVFSLWALVTSSLGGFVGIWAAWRLQRG